jgi:hypothetical protein
MITKAQRAQRITKFPQRLHLSQPYQLIKRGSQTACNRKLGYHDSCTFCKCSILYPWIVITSLAKRLEKISFLSFFTLPLVYGPVITTCRYKGLLKEYVMHCYGFPNKRSPHVVLRFPTQTSPLAPCGSDISQSMMKCMSQSMMPFPLNRARQTTYSNPN